MNMKAFIKKIKELLSKEFYCSSEELNKISACSFGNFCARIQPKHLFFELLA